MNTVKCEGKTSSFDTVLVALLLQCSHGRVQTAFFGQCEDGPTNSLYLIAFDRVVLASEPWRAWSVNATRIYVNRFVDVEMKVL